MNKISAAELNKVKEESYDKWFERWYKKQDLPKKLKEAAMQGYTSYYIDIDNRPNEYSKRRMSNLRFVEKLKEELPDFRVFRKEPEEHQARLLGRSLGTRWTSLKTFISWEESE